MDSETESNSFVRCLGVMAASMENTHTSQSASNVAEIDGSINNESSKKTTKRNKKKSVEARLTEFEGNINVLTKLVMKLERMLVVQLRGKICSKKIIVERMIKSCKHTIILVPDQNKKYLTRSKGTQ